MGKPFGEGQGRGMLRTQLQTAEGDGKAKLKGTGQVCPASGMRPTRREDGQSGTQGPLAMAAAVTKTRSTNVRAPVLLRGTRALKALQCSHPSRILTFGQ